MENSCVDFNLFQVRPAPSHMAVHSGLMLALYAWNSGKCARVEFIWNCPEQVEVGAADCDWELAAANKRVESKMLSLIFLFTAFHKAGKILRITPNFTLSLKPEASYLRREITEHLGRDCTSALLFCELPALWRLIYDLCRNLHLSLNLALNHAVLVCSELFLGRLSLI